MLFNRANATLKVRPARVELEDGKAYSPEFEDIYATRSGAYGQACHVFLSEGDIPNRWADKESFTIACGQNGLKIFELQLEGKKRMDTKSFLAGFQLEKGKIFGK